MEPNTEYVGPYERSPYATVPSTDRPYPLRSLFDRYRDFGGACWVDANPTEMSVAQKEGEITCFARSKFQMGHPYNGLYVGPPPAVHASPQHAMEIAMAWISDAMDTGLLWCPNGSVRYTFNSKQWVCTEDTMEGHVAELMTATNTLAYNPIRVSVVHSAMESEKLKNKVCFEDLYPYPRTTVPSAGLFGTDHNNHAIDMSPFEKDKEPNLADREFLDEYVGYVCPTYTSHSYEAGRSRRLTTDTHVRLLSYATYRSLDMIKERIPPQSEGDWTVCCAGQFFRVCASTVMNICIFHKLSSLHSDPEIGVYISEEAKICVICVGSGVVSKRCSNSVWADNCNTYMSDHTGYAIKPRISREGSDFHRACLSGHFSYIPFVEHNAAIRTSITSAQILQAVCLPYCPATAAVSPCNVFSPLVTTPRYKRIMSYQEKCPDVASFLPGENLCILYHNLPLNYEDSTFVSKRYSDLGGFSTMSICRYSLPATDFVPEKGQVVCSVLSPWWKSPCQTGCKHTKEYISKSKSINPFGAPTGIVTSKIILTTGVQSVKVRSFEQFQAGNKVSTGHGQKGVSSAIVPYEDMPVCTLDDGTQMVPDMVIAVGSIVSRQTMGQIYESIAGLERLRTSDYDWVIEPDQTMELVDCMEVRDGATGESYSTLVLEPGSSLREQHLVPTRATIGFARVFNQSQMTRERHFTSHRSMRSTTLRTPVKRSKGGAVRVGEMEVQAAIASGLPNCVREMRRRGDEVMVHLCTTCQRLRLLHSCTEKTEFVELTLPYDTVVLDCMNKIIYNHTFKYDYVPDV